MRDLNHDIDTTVSGLQSTIALEALVSAAFILISSKVGDLIGRKRAYVLGLSAYVEAAPGDEAARASAMVGTGKSSTRASDVRSLGTDSDHRARNARADCRWRWTAPLRLSLPETHARGRRDTVDAAEPSGN